jgi:hypothetical protein
VKDKTSQGRKGCFNKEMLKKKRVVVVDMGSTNGIIFEVPHGTSEIS